MEFTPVLMDVANAIGVEFNPKYEKYVKSGRMDCFYNCIDLEYKVPGAIEPQNVYFARKSMNDSYLEEVHRQIEGYSIKEKVDKRKILGIIFDGKRIIYTYYLTTDWHNSVPQEEYAYDEFFDWIKENKEVVMGAAFVLIIAITVAIMVPTGGTSAVTIPSVLTAVEAAFI